MKKTFSKLPSLILDQESFRSSRAHRFAYYALLFILFSHIVIVGLLCATPPISRDALIHHLAIPKLWLKHGGFYETPWVSCSYFPMNVDLLYLGSLYFKNDILPKYIHFAFGLGTGLLIYFYLRQRLTRNWGLLGMLIYITTPIVTRLSTTAYVDLGLTFFTTASLIAFVKWRDDGYKNAKWLIISGACMGLAAGSKYNALIACVFLNLMIAFHYSRYTKKELPALKYGLIFFVVTLIIASPWYIKNYLLTSNPLYPMFDKIFNPAHHAGGQGGGIGLFQKREMMYGETLWEILLIPIRMFFQGKDNSDQYFYGALNPILIVMLPFAFFNKETGRDRILFFSFSLFFLVIPLFLIAPSVRYILPVVPFLAILTVAGIKGLVDRLNNSRGLTRNIGLTGTFLVTVILIGCNILYLKNYFNIVRPIGYILNRETKDEFLSRHLGSYPAMRYVNENLAADAKISLFFLAGRGYYLDRAYRLHSGYGMGTIKDLVQASDTSKAFVACLRSLDSTHLLVRNDLFEKYLRDNFTTEKIGRFLSLTSRYWEDLYQDVGYTVFRLKLQAEEL